MRLVVLCWLTTDGGSATTVHSYARIAEKLGHELVVYGPVMDSPFSYSTEVSESDALVFVFESQTALEYGDSLDLARLVARVPRERRIVVDQDGGYNDAIRISGGDCNHLDLDASARWIEICDSLSDKIVQPTLHPLRENVGTFFWHAYEPGWEQPLAVGGKDYGMCYVGNNWRRWRALRRFLQMLEPVREEVGRIVLIGRWWDLFPWPSPFDDTDPDYLRRLGVELREPVQFDCVMASMGLGTFTPVIYRPLYDRLQLVTCRTFETPAANTLPLFCQTADFVSEIYGEAALELRLPDDDPHEKILDLLERPDHYVGIVEGIRAHLRQKYSYERQFGRLVELIEA
jgi:hypothetical protein